MFSKDKKSRGRGRHSNYQDKAFDEANLQPLDFSGRDDSKAASPVELPTLNAADVDDAFGSKPKLGDAKSSQPVLEERPQVKGKSEHETEPASAAVVFAGAASAADAAVSADAAFADDASIAKPHVGAPAVEPDLAEETAVSNEPGQHYGAHSRRALAEEDAQEAGVVSAGEEAPAEVETDAIANEPEAPTVIAGELAAGPVVSEAAFDNIAALNGVEHESAAAYSRKNATYEHRRGWSSLATWQKRLFVIVLVLVALIAAAAGAAIALWQNTNEEVQIQDNELTESLTAVEDENIDPYWVLILGSDSRSQKTDRARSDVLMMARIDPNTPRVTLVSIPRDTKVNIKGYGVNKINAAYALGGASLAVKTVESYAGIKISHYVEIYFSGLEDLVDKLGGVTVNVPEYVKYSDVELKPGKQSLTGHQALIFARCRKTYTQGDFTRTQCQRILVSALVKKVLAQDATNLPSVVTSAAKCFKTDMALEDLIALAQRMQGLTSKNIYSGMAPSTTGMVDGVSYTFTYINQWKVIMQKAKQGKKPTLTDEEKTICGSVATNTEDMDMSESLSKDIKSQLEKYWASQEKKKADAAAKKLKKQQESQASDQSQESESTQSEESQQANQQAA